MKVFVLLLAPMLLPACSNRPANAAQEQAKAADMPQTTVYISARVAEPVADKPVADKPVIEASQPDATPMPMPAATVQTKGHHRGVKRVSRSRQHAVIHAEHGSFHSITPD